MQKWEYVVAHVVRELKNPFAPLVANANGQFLGKPGLISWGGKNLYAWLQEMGAEGWEVVSASVVSTGSFGNEGHTIILKRPLP